MSFLSNVRNLIEGTYHHLLDQWNVSPTHIKEQATLRAWLCQDCLAEGRCPNCGCSTPGMFFAPAKQCPLDKWGPMLSPEDWEKHKESHRLSTAGFATQSTVTGSTNLAVSTASTLFIDDKYLANNGGYIQPSAGSEDTVPQPHFDPAMSSSSIY